MLDKIGLKYHNSLPDPEKSLFPVGCLEKLEQNMSGSKRFITIFLVGFILVLANVGTIFSDVFEDAMYADESGNYAEAFRLMKPLAEQGDVKAQNILGFYYHKGLGVKQSDRKAVKWYRKAAEQEQAEAQYILGVAYFSGHGVVRNYKKAVNWYRKAAEQGDVGAQYNLGLMYLNGQGVPQDYKEAMKWAIIWFRKAAEQGDIKAQYNLGLMYHRGKGVPQDYTEAMKWYREAAEQGDDFAQYRLGEIYSYGRDHLIAYMWFEIAKTNGNTWAENKMTACVGYLLQEDVKKAKMLAQEWLEKHKQ